MNSSISLSRRLVLIGALAFLASLLAGWAYTARVNPEIRFWKQALVRKQAWATEQRAKTGHLTVFSGGSTTAFQIDPKLLADEFGAATVNAGFHAGMGLDGATALASTFLKPGDRLVIMSEPAVLADEVSEMPALGEQMLSVSGVSSQAFYRTGLAGQSRLTQTLAACRPGLAHASTMLGKVLMRRPAYRYSAADDLHDGGYLTTPVREDFTSVPSQLAAYRLSESSKKFLIDLKAWAAAHQIEVVYLLPVSYVPAGDLAAQRRLNQTLQEEIAQFIPVWTDSYLGAWPVPTDFADSKQHMISSAAAARTRELGRAHFSP
ncbi:MAG: hypothetical protein JWO82_422 [Akkermansiaceae bacterium]|nr:hypothetical protein [Akkermansiaceae bacterium]